MNTENENNKEIVKNGKFFSSYKKWIVLAALFIFITAGIGTYAFAKMHRFHEDGPLGFMIDRLTDGLDLSKDQKDQVERLKTAIKEKRDSQRDSKKNNFDELISSFKNSDLDRSKLNDWDQKRSAKEQEMKEFAKDKILEFYNILTPAQRTKAADKMSDFKNKMYDKMDRNHDDHGNDHGRDDDHHHGKDHK